MRIANDILIPELARLLAEGKEVRFTPSGVSMRPFIEGDKDSVVLAQLTRAPRVGDILLVQSETLCGKQTYVLHRLVRIEDVHYVLQGDGNLAGEERCEQGDIIGRVIAIETPSGRRKPLTRARLWYALRPIRNYLLKIYRHTILKWLYK
ncbi:MAG: peptidase S41 [Paludibacteraceae bacterium]|nr:peptidase S41 [Paludibacteraceae bacterium]